MFPNNGHLKTDDTGKIESIYDDLFALDKQK
jgi:hypothetical protein